MVPYHPLKDKNFDSNTATFGSAKVNVKLFTVRFDFGSSLDFDVCLCGLISQTAAGNQAQSKALSRRQYSHYMYLLCRGIFQRLRRRKIECAGNAREEKTRREAPLSSFSPSSPMHPCLPLSAPTSWQRTFEN